MGRTHNSLKSSRGAQRWGGVLPKAGKQERPHPDCFHGFAAPLPEGDRHAPPFFETTRESTREANVLAAIQTRPYPVKKSRACEKPRSSAPPSA